jgi:hypothetical protein
MAPRDNSEEAVAAAWKFANLFNRRFRDREQGLAELSKYSRSAREDSEKALKAIDQIRKTGTIKNPDKALDNLRSAHWQLESMRPVERPLATDPKPPAGITFGEVLIAGIAMFVLFLVAAQCGSSMRFDGDSTRERPRVHYRDPRP